MRHADLTRRTAMALLLGGAAIGHATAADAALLNVSYDPTRELYRDINRAFTAAWQERTGQRITVNQSHGGSGAQARAVLDGLPADVVTLALGADIDMIARRGLIAADWQTRLPDNAAPFTSTIVFLVRKDNPKSISDWPDLIKPGVEVIAPNPKTSGGARWTFLAALGWAQRLPGATAETAELFTRALYRHTPLLDIGARAATTSFLQRGLGDVLPSWENEAWLARREFGAENFTIVYPSISILAEPPVAMVDSVVDKKGTRRLAQAYLEFLYTKQAQEIAARNFYRPRDVAVATQYAESFPTLNFITIRDFGGWDAAQAAYFADGGMFDRVFAPGR